MGHSGPNRRLTAQPALHAGAVSPDFLLPLIYEQREVRLRFGFLSILLTCGQGRVVRLASLAWSASFRQPPQQIRQDVE